MAHKVLVNGAAYAVKGGKTLVGGTGYSVKGGRTLVGGTGYAILFPAPGPSYTINVVIDNCPISKLDIYVNDVFTKRVGTGHDDFGSGSVTVNYGDVISIRETESFDAPLYGFHTESAFVNVNFNNSLFTGTVIGNGSINFVG